MGFVENWTVRVLTDGLPPLPDRLERGQTVPAAVWRGKHAGAVHFLRLWKNGQPDCDTAISERRSDGSWEEPHFCGGNAWVDDPLTRPDEGWGGYPVVWPGQCGAGEVRVIRGAASKLVAGLEVEYQGRTSIVPINSPCGAFIVGFESPGVARVTAVDADGRPVINRDGAPEELVVDDFMARDFPSIPPGIFKSTRDLQAPDG